MTHNKTDQYNALCDEFASRVTEVERTVIAAGWLDPIALNDAGYTVGLCGADFANIAYSWLFNYICLHAESGTRPTVPEAVDVAGRVGIPVNEFALFNLILKTQTCTGMLSTYCDTVRHYAKQRKIASKHLQRIGRILNLPGWGDEATAQTGQHAPKNDHRHNEILAHPTLRQQRARLGKGTRSA